MHFQKTECLVKAIKKWFLKKLSVWLTLIKVAVWGVNYQKGQCTREFISYLNQYCEIIFFLPILANNNLPLKIYCESILIIYKYYYNYFFLFLKKLFFSHQY